MARRWWARGRWSRRGRRLGLGAAAVLVLVAGCGGGGSSASSSSTGPSDVERASAALVEVRRLTDELAPGEQRDLADCPFGDLDAIVATVGEHLLLPTSFDEGPSTAYAIRASSGGDASVSCTRHTRPTVASAGTISVAVGQRTTSDDYADELRAAVSGAELLEPVTVEGGVVYPYCLRSSDGGFCAVDLVLDEVDVWLSLSLSGSETVPSDDGLGADAVAAVEAIADTVLGSLAGTADEASPTSAPKPEVGPLPTECRPTIELGTGEQFLLGPLAELGEDEELTCAYRSTRGGNAPASIELGRTVSHPDQLGGLDAVEQQYSRCKGDRCGDESAEGRNYFSRRVRLGKGALVGGDISDVSLDDGPLRYYGAIIVSVVSYDDRSCSVGWSGPADRPEVPETLIEDLLDLAAAMCGLD